MATLTGKLADVTSKTPENISSITVKAPSARIGSGTDVIVSSPAEVTFDKTTGGITISGLTGGLSWIYIEGDGWSDSIPLAVAEGMITLVEAIANAAGVAGLADYINLINNAEDAIQGFVDGIRADTYGGFQPASVDVNTLLAGGTNSNSRVYYRMGAHGSTPNGDSGVLDVTNTGYIFSQVFYSTTTGAVYTRTITDRSNIVPGEWVFGEWNKLATHDDISTKTDKSYVDGADQALGERIDNEKWRKGLLYNTHLDTVTTAGMYRQHNNSSATTANGYPEGATQGVLQVVDLASGMVHQTYSTKDRVWVRRSYNGAFGEPWVELGSGGGATPVEVDWVKGLLYSNHLDTITDDGIYRQHSSGSAAIANGYPEGAGRGILQVVGITATEIHQTYSTQAGAWVRRIISGEPTMWAQLNPTVEQYQITQNFQAAEEKPGINWAERNTRIDQMRQAVGRVNTGGKAAICLSFDHGTKNFKEFILPALQARGLKSSLALNSQRLDPSYGHYASEGATWAEVKAWADSGVEITNHSRTHQGAIGETDIYREIVLGREELEAHIDRPVWTWRGHGYLGGDDHNYDGYGANSKRPEAYYDFYAGKLLLSAHPMVTGGIQRPYDCFPLDGEIPIGPRGAWIDTPSQMATAKANIQHAVDTGQRIYINCHPQFVEFNSEYIDRQALFDFFDYVKGFIDAGQLVDLTFAEWAVADSGETVVTGGVDKGYVDHELATKADLETLDTRIPETLALSRDTSVGTRIMSGDTMVYGDTGWRTIWDPSNTPTMDSGRVLSSRSGDFVTLVFDQCIFNAEHPALNAIPAGFRGLPVIRAIQLYSGDWPSPGATGRVSAAGWLNLYRVPVGVPIFGQVTYQTREAWPATLPGTPA